MAKRRKKRLEWEEEEEEDQQQSYSRGQDRTARQDRYFLPGGLERDLAVVPGIGGGRKGDASVEGRWGLWGKKGGRRGLVSALLFSASPRWGVDGADCYCL